MAMMDDVLPHRRERSWALVGLALALGANFQVVEPSSFSHQHYVPPPQRRVPYGERYSAVTRKDGGSMNANAPRSDDESYATNIHAHEEQSLWQVVVDASSEQRESALSRPRTEERRLQDGSVHKGLPLRLLQSAYRLLQESPGFINTEEADFDESNTTSAEFNVTAGTEYNVTAGNNSTNDTATVVFTDSEQTDETETKSFHPLRISAFLSQVAGGGEHLSEEQRKILFEDILQEAMLAWSRALRVNPVVGNLTVDSNQLLDGATCGPGAESGLPSVDVPPGHLTVGVPNTDMILYITLAFVEETGTEAPSNATSVPRNTTAVGTALESLENGLASLNNATGGYRSSAGLAAPSVAPSQEPVANLFNHTEANRTANNQTSISPRETCTGDFLAASTFCSTDQFDRPTAAHLHLCVGLDFFDTDNIESDIMLVMHEIGHSLGFNAISLAHFRRPDGTPITPRVDGKVPVQEVECTGPLESRRFENVTLPSPEILQFREVRGVRVAEVVTPSVVQVARNHFDCQELQGAELESAEALPWSTNPGEVACLGDHWERRLFKSDLMNPLLKGVETSTRISTITLAYFADSGWYQVDLSRAAHPAGWGRGVGCDFVEEPCIRPDGTVPPRLADFFCDKAPSIEEGGDGVPVTVASEIQGCTPDLSRKAACWLGSYDKPLPKEYQYFGDKYGTGFGGDDPFMDYCPSYFGFEDGLCVDADNAERTRITLTERFGRKNSRCLSGNVETERTGLCVPIACVVDDRSLMVQVDGIWRTCAFKGQYLPSRSGSVITCPEPARICPTFYCTRDCLGTARACDYSVGECVCTTDSCERSATDNETVPMFFNPGAFYNRNLSDSNLPDADSPLSDYYVPSARQLNEDSGGFDLMTWRMLLISVGTLLVVVAVAAACAIRRRTVDQSPGTDPDNDGDATPATSREKHKMIAHVVVDLRMAAPNLHNIDILHNRASETDLSMTDTDVGTHASLDALDTSVDFSVEDPLRAPETNAEPGQNLVRRRPVLPGR